MSDNKNISPTFWNSVVPTLPVFAFLGFGIYNGILNDQVKEETLRETFVTITDVELHFDPMAPPYYRFWADVEDAGTLICNRYSTSSGREERPEIGSIYRAHVYQDYHKDASSCGIDLFEQVNEIPILNRSNVPNAFGTDEWAPHH